MEIMLIEHSLAFFVNLSSFFQPNCSNTISSEVPRLIDVIFYVTHSGVGLYQSYGNYVDAAILSA